MMCRNFDTRIFLILSYLCAVISAQSTIRNPCNFNQYRCSDGSACLQTEKLCNGRRDCPNGEEDRGSYCKSTELSQKCQSTEFQCRFGGCIPKDKQCDGIADCQGGSDEAKDFCGKRKPTASRPTITATRPPQTPAPTRPPTPAWVDQNPYPPQPPAPKPTPSRPAPPPPPPQSSSDGGKTCPPIPVEDGQRVNCFINRLAREIFCNEHYSPEDTIANFQCKEFYNPPASGDKTKRTCTNGRWTGGRRDFRCDLDCGTGGYKPAQFIAGGQTSVRGKWPWHAGLYEKDQGGNRYKHICGATLISKRAILTAAHCVTYAQSNRPKDASSLLIFLGKFFRDANKNEDGEQRYRVSKVVVNDNYHYANLESDIAILWLEQDVAINQIAHPICLPNRYEEELPWETTGWLAGWGSTGNRQYPDELHEAQLPLVSSPTCRADHPALGTLVRTSTFCAGYTNGTSACDGDSGGGLVFPRAYQKNKWYIMGIVSGGVPKAGSQGCDSTHYVAFTNVAQYKPWIQEILDQAPDDKRKK